MSNAVGTATEQPASKPPGPGLTAKQLLEAVKDNFVLVSATAVLVGVVLSTMFLAAYLSVFDWHLLWFVQYTDIITFGLLAVGVIGGSLTFMQSAAQTVLGLFGMKGRSWWMHGIFLLVLVFGIVAFQLWDAKLSGEGYFHILLGATVLGLGIVLIMQIVGYVATVTLPNLTQAFWLLLSLGFTTVSLGQWLGYSVQESSKCQDITLKDKTLSDMKVVIVMSRYTVLFKDNVLYVVPTGDITKFQSVDKNAKPRVAPKEE
jgi:hypothetical protein